MQMPLHHDHQLTCSCTWLLIPENSASVPCRCILIETKLGGLLRLILSIFLELDIRYNKTWF